MKKIRVRSGNLEIRNASLTLGRELQVIKISKEQAMKFPATFSSWDEMVALYGVKNILQEGEFYEGYVAVRWGCRFKAVWMTGKLVRFTDQKACQWANPVIRDACAEGRLWDVVYPLKDGKTCPGAFKYVWTFNGCRFMELAADMIQKGYLPATEDAELIASSLKRKLTEAAVNSDVAELTDEENLLAKYYLGSDYYGSFFTEVE